MHDPLALNVTPTSGPRHRRPSRAAMALLLIATLTGLLVAAPAEAAAATVQVRGVVQCPAGKPVTGIYIQSSGGGSGFAIKNTHWRTFPGYPHIANVVRNTTMNRPSDVQVHVGCGGTSQKWGSNNKSGTLRVRNRTYVDLNVWCNGQGSCQFPNNRSASPAPPTVNPLTTLGYQCECTWYAAESVKSAIGRYPNWYLGHAKTWADNAQARGWTVTSLPRPGSVVVWPAGVAGASGYGHVGFVHASRINADGTIDLVLSDKNWTRCTVRSGVTVRYHPSMRFIVMPAVSGA